MKKIAPFLSTCIAASLVAICPDPADHGEAPKPKPPTPAEQPVVQPPVPKTVCHEEERPDCPPIEAFPHAGPHVCESSEVFLYGTFILWAPRQDGLEYALSGTGTNPSRGNVHNIDFGIEPGFKIGIGYSMPHDGWDLLAEYTWLQGDADDATSRSSNLSLFTPDQNTITRAKAKWDFKYNVFDMELGRNFFVSRFLKLRPFAGFKGAWQDQDYNVQYTGNGALPNAESKVSIYQDFWGFGVRGGCDSSWHFTNTWSIFGNLALSALWSGYDVERTDQIVFLGQNIPTVNTENQYHTISPVLELMIGLRFERWFYGDQYHIAFDAGWEEQVWWGHNRYVVINQAQNNGGNLSFQGLTATLRFDF